MKYRTATPQDTLSVLHIVQTTIQTIYPSYYPMEVVDFFRGLHNRERVSRDIRDGKTGILVVEGQIVGTGSRADNHITRVYVLPEFQGMGYGGFIMECLENEIAAASDTAVLDASLPACCFYERRGYHTVRHEKMMVENGVALVYEVMEKRLPARRP